MAVLTFDTHTLVKRFKAAGFTEEQAEVTVDAVKESITSTELVTKSDLKELEIRLIKWVVGVGVAGVVAIAGLLKYIH